MTAAPQNPEGPGFPVRTRVVTALLVVSVAALLHLIVGFRPVPSIDDFAYIPFFRHLADPSLYPRDALLQSMSLHSLAWYAIARLSDAGGDFAAGAWVATLALSVATVAALWRLATTMRVPAALLPIFALLACASEMHGVGRGQLDGIFGAGLHGQWIALACLLFSYDAFLRGRLQRSGVFLGLSAIGHLSVAMHGGFVLAMASLLMPGPRRHSLATIAGISSLIALPALLPVLSHLSHDPGQGWPLSRLIHDGYIFRLSQEYSAGLTRSGWLSATLKLLAGTGGALLLRSTDSPSPYGRVLALALGHLLLLVGAVVFYGLLPDLSLAPYLLALTRTSPLLAMMASLLALSGFSAHIRAGGREEAPFQLLLAAGVAIALLLELRLLVNWDRSSLALLALAPLLALTFEAGRTRTLALTAALASVVALSGVAIRNQDRLESAPGNEAAALYAWARGATPAGAVFVVPPGMQDFRWYSMRSAYVDFKMFPSASVGGIAAWRERLNDVAAPDRRARRADGWNAARELDRCYASRNSPARIAVLLERTGADYFVWDADGLRIPPMTGTDRTPAAGLGEVFRNSRFVVYRALAESAGGGSRD